MGLCLANPTDRFVTRNILGTIPTPARTYSWKPVPHLEVVKAVESAILDRNLRIVDERFGLSREGQKMFGVITLASHGNPEWTRCIGVRNSHDQSFAAGICVGISVLVCSNLAFGGEFVFKRRHTSGIDIDAMATQTLDVMSDGFLTLEERVMELKDVTVTDDQARLFIMRAAEIGVVPSCDILQVFNEFKRPRHEEFAEPTQWALLNSFTEISHKYPAAKSDVFHRKLTRLFGLDGQIPAISAI